MAGIKFVDSLPERGNPTRRNAWVEVRRQLHANPGQWAEVHRAPKSDGYKAYNARVSVAGRDPGIEAQSRVVGDEIVVYARAVTA